MNSHIIKLNSKRPNEIWGVRVFGEDLVAGQDLLVKKSDGTSQKVTVRKRLSFGICSNGQFVSIWVIASKF